jgi:hypothetical protein
MLYSSSSYSFNCAVAAGLYSLVFIFDTVADDDDDDDDDMMMMKLL